MIRAYIAYPKDSYIEPHVVVRLAGEQHEHSEIKLEGARLLRQQGHDIEPDDVDFHST